jgi:hypothetical protein
MEWLPYASLILSAIIAGAGWWYRSSKETETKGRENGATQTSLRGLERAGVLQEKTVMDSLEALEKNMEAGFKRVDLSIMEVKTTLHTCRSEETTRINRLEDKLESTIRTRKGG